MMADVAGLVLAVGQILSALYEYGQTTSHARQDIKDLSTELLVLQGILRQVEKRDLTKSSIIAIGQHSDPQNVLKSTERSLETLLRNLKVPASGFKKVVNYAKWPLDKKDVVDQLSRFERLKSLLILTFLTEASEEISNAVQSLKISMEQDLNRIDDFLSWQKDSQLIRWLAPLSPEERHLRFCNEREPETRKWFLDGPFDTWVSGPDQGVMCLTGKCMSLLLTDCCLPRCSQSISWYWENHAVVSLPNTTSLVRGYSLDIVLLLSTNCHKSARLSQCGSLHSGTAASRRQPVSSRRMLWVLFCANSHNMMPPFSQMPEKCTSKGSTAPS